MRQRRSARRLFAIQTVRSSVERHRLPAFFPARFPHLIPLADTPTPSGSTLAGTSSATSVHGISVVSASQFCVVPLATPCRLLSQPLCRYLGPTCVLFSCLPACLRTIRSTAHQTNPATCSPSTKTLQLAVHTPSVCRWPSYPAFPPQ